MVELGHCQKAANSLEISEYFLETSEYFLETSEIGMRIEKYNLTTNGMKISTKYAERKSKKSLRIEIGACTELFELPGLGRAGPGERLVDCRARDLKFSARLCPLPILPEATVAGVSLTGTYGFK